jgi:hypothetical protein
VVNNLLVFENLILKLLVCASLPCAVMGKTNLAKVQFFHMTNFS